MHYLVLVIGQDWEEQLAPYQENSMGTCDPKYLMWVDMSEEVKSDYQDSSPGVFTDTGEFLFKWDIRVHKLGLTDRVTETAHTDIYPDLHSCATKYSGCKFNVDTCQYGHWENPNSKLDWYQLASEPDSRWHDYLKLKPNTELSTSVKVKDIDWQSMKDKKIKVAQTQWELFTQWLAKGFNSEDRNYPTLHFGIRAADTETGYETLESFISHSTSIAPFVFLHKGVWHERSMERPLNVWESQFQSMLDSLSPDELITVVDVHT